MRRIFLWACSVVLCAFPAAAAFSESYGKLPLTFEANQGQVDEPVRFLSRGQGYALFLTPTEAVLSLRGATVVRMRPVGGNPDPRLIGASPQATTSNYLLGNDPRQWNTGVPHYARVRVESVYPGIDLVYRGNQRQLEYDFVIAPGADPGRIRLAFQGVDAIELGARGEMILHTPNGDLVQHAPVIYQETGARRRFVKGRFVLGARHEVGFEVGRYDQTRPLIIDPVISYSTFLGGGNEDTAIDIAVDGAGNAYITGGTQSATFPGVGPGSIQPVRGDFEEDAFVTKINAAGTAILYSTFLGGSSFSQGLAIAVDGAGNAYVTGQTDSDDFPGVSGSSIQPAHAGLMDGFVTKINAAGTAILYSTFLGGNRSDFGIDIAVDGGGNAYISGATDSTTLPGVGGSSIQPARAGGPDAFVMKINATGTAILYSTFLGGSSLDQAVGIAVDGVGNAYVTGKTNSTTFAGVSGSSIQPANAGGSDAFVMKIDPAGTAIVYSTFLGDSSFNLGSGIAVDGAGNAYVTGRDSPTDFFGNGDAFVIKINPAGTAVAYSTLLGGSGDDNPSDIAVDAAGNAYVTGRTSSPDFPGVNAGSIQPAFGGSFDAFLTRIGPMGTVLGSTFLGGSEPDSAHGIAVDVAGGVYITGSTFSPTFPGVGPGSIQPTNGFEDAFVTKISFEALSLAEVPTLSQWGLISMALLLAALGLFGIWRQV